MLLFLGRCCCWWGCWDAELTRSQAVEGANDFIMELANEPAVGLYYLQEHVQSNVPVLMEMKGRFKECTKKAHKEM